MPRDYSARENGLKAKARREHALKRLDLREPTSPREAPAGATSFPVKKVDRETADAIAAFMARRESDGR